MSTLCVEMTHLWRVIDSSGSLMCEPCAAIELGLWHAVRSNEVTWAYHPRVNHIMVLKIMSKKVVSPCGISILAMKNNLVAHNCCVPICHGYHIADREYIIYW